MDLLGPLPKSAQGHEFTLVMVDYTTRYPEAISRQKATLKNITCELILLFSLVGLWKDSLIDQGTHFVSWPIQELCQLLQVKHLHTLVYPPQMDGLVECFDQTLKRMLRCVVDEQG